MTTTKKTTEKEAEKKPVAKAAKAPAKGGSASSGKSSARKVEAKGETPVGTYIYARGRRKAATATAKMWTTGKGEITVNEQPYKKFFKTFDLQDDVMAPLKAVGLEETATVEIRVSGGGPRGQAEASRLAISRCLLKVNEELRKTLKPLGYLKRDPREKERKHYGLKKARKAPQWAKR